MLVTEESDAVVDRASELAAKVEARFAIARDAVTRGKSHGDEATGQFFSDLFETLPEFRLDGPDDEPLDERVLRSLSVMKPLRDYLLEFVDIVNKSERSAELHCLLRPFLGRLLALKHAPRNVVSFNHLWCDPYRLLLRELFLGVIAMLIANRDYDEVNRYLEADYLFETSRGPQRADFLKFDAYIKTLDEFRPRRLRQNRLSVAADVLRERTDLAFLGFDDIMQADFLLCVRGLLHHPRALTRWFPRTLVYAEQFEKRGFDLFFAAQSKAKFPPIQAVLGVRDKADLLQRFEAVSRDCSLADWKFGGVPIPFEQFMGLSALETV